MGRGASTVRRCVDHNSVFNVPDTFPEPPKSLAPDFETHQLYLKELETYLLRVAKMPCTFEKKVKRRRAACFRDLNTLDMQQQLRLLPCAVHAEADWLSVGP